MSEHKKINTSNYYDMMDKKEEKNNIKERKLVKRKIISYKIKSYILEFIKLFLLILIMTSVFWTKYVFPDFYNNTLMNTESKIMQTIGLEKENNLKIQKDEVIINNNNSAKKDNLDIPEITITGVIEKDSDKYVVFKYNNKIYTEKVGDKFSDNTYEIISISNKILEIKDFNGNSFKLPIKLKK